VEHEFGLEIQYYNLSLSRLCAALSTSESMDRCLVVMSWKMGQQHRRNRSMKASRTPEITRGECREESPRSRMKCHVIDVCLSEA